MMLRTDSATRRPLVADLSFLDRFLTLWIVLAMGLGTLGIRFPADSFRGGLIAMMYPPFASRL